ncbi:hypothetical protein [uncultured Oscillibacter sp.]|uniref:hypothetical protein n=1 Tax=uncultured Oscillibacter sp. TaxID=876091 RepID=UPI00272A5BC2|nr:hypothetical protein [uncultured Oscillibacter sp.]
MSVIHLEATGQEALARAEKLLGDLPGGVEKAVRSAMARSVSHLRTGSVRAIRERYDISAANVRADENVFVRYSYQNGVQATVTFAGRRIPLYRFGGASPSRPSGRVSAWGHALKSTSPTQFLNAFVARMPPPASHTGIFERTGAKTSSGKDQIRELFGPAVPQMLGSRDVEERLSREAMEKFEDRLDHEINAILNGWRGVPYESPSNKNLKMDACVLEDGTEVNLTWPQVELIAGDWGVVTAVNFLDSGWVAKGNYTACFPGNTDVKDQFIPVSRMFDYIGNTLIRTFWPKQDKPLTPPLRDSILRTCNIWLSGLCGSGYLYGARCELLAAENPLAELLAGHITLHVYHAPPVPAQRIDFILEYDVSYMETALTA